MNWTVSPWGENQEGNSQLCAYHDWCSMLLWSSLSLVYFPPFPFPLLLMMTVFSSPLPVINTTSAAPPPPLFQHSLSIPSLEERGWKKRCLGAMMASAMLLCGFVSTYCVWVQPGVFVIPCGYSYTSHAGRKHINLITTNSEKKSLQQCVCQETAED